jgi:hypothetical protein
MCAIDRTPGAYRALPLVSGPFRADAARRRLVPLRGRAESLPKVTSFSARPLQPAFPLAPWAVARPQRWRGARSRRGPRAAGRGPRIVPLNARRERDAPRGIRVPRGSGML